MIDATLLESAASPSTNFDAFAWVEEALSSRSGDASYLTPLVPQLALRSQTLAQTLHASLQHVSLAAPALQTRLGALQQNVTPLARRLDAVQEACATDSVSATSPGQDLRHLVTLHEAKRRLQSCSQALVEAARWGRNVRACFAAVEDPTLLSQVLKSDFKLKNRTENEAEALPNRVREMQTSLEVLKDLPGAWDRKQTMERLCAQIEAAVQPRLVTSMREDDLGDVAPLRWCLDVLGSVDRAELVREEFCRTRPAHVHRVWYAYSEQSQTEQEKEEGTGESFATWLEMFYGDVLRMLQRESRNAKELFGSDTVISVLLALLHNTLEPLTKSFRDRLEPSGPGFHLGRLLRCFQATRGFAGRLVQFFRSLEIDFGVTLVNSDDNVVHAEDILRVVFEPYRLYFTEYTRFTSDALTDALLRLVPAFNASTNREQGSAGVDDEFEGQVEGDAAPLDEFSQHLEEASEAVWTLVNESLQQCYEFTGGAAFPEAVEAIGAAVQQFTLALSATVPAIRKYCNTLLDEAQRAVRSWTMEAQLLTYDTVFLPIARVLETLPTNENWYKMPDAALGDLPTFSMLPQDYITMVADLLLSLLPQLEPFAESNSLENAFVASRGAQEACVQGEWAQLGQMLHLAPPELASCQRIFGSEGKVAATEPAPTATEFVDLWTAAVASGALAAFLRTVCSIPLLSELGAQQLSADLGYFHNVLSAVGGEGNFIVDDLRCALDMDLPAHMQHVEELRAECDNPEKQALAKINDCVTSMRQRALEPSRRLSAASSGHGSANLATSQFY
ncbi:hypothetical protein G195_001236 [Phytophthora kernoviae 00238/432]|uniref:Conserved oligomeric Golgi complex subunit 7 n=1 Tax=Phytophthora kernoviae 00238/432 TaxID=1284355 RepID=A0A8J4WI81_9STRA|nr:hypothetical protein G195_001236 [Phytophthora kernoviae 00238/432]